MKIEILLMCLVVFVSCAQNQSKIINPEKQVFISNIDFFVQAPFQTEENWKIHTESCEEASVLLYTSFLLGKKHTADSFNQELMEMKKYQTVKYGDEKDLQKNELADFINDYFRELQAKTVQNIGETKISWLLQEQKPVLIGIQASDISNPYYHYSRYHTLLIVGETENDYIVKDVGTKHGNDWKYPKEELLQAIQNSGNWGIMIEKVKNDTVNVEMMKSDTGYNYSSFQSQSFYSNLILDEKCCIDVELPKDIGAGIIAHHLTVGVYFDNYFRKLKETKPNIETFIVAGTNHFNFDTAIYTTDLDYQTPFGVLKINTDEAKNIKGWQINNELLKNEHSIHSIVGFIKKYYPNSTLVPFIINENIEKMQLDVFKDEIASIYQTNSFYLQSTDFTHFQPQYATDFFDLYSKNALNDFDSTRTENMWVDSRKLMYFTFELLEKLGLKKNYLLKNSSSNSLNGVENFQNTSHFFTYFGKGAPTQKSNQVSLLFTGDMILNYDLPIYGVKKENGKNENIAYPFDKIDSFEETFFRGYDEIITNIEGNFGTNFEETDIPGGPIYFTYDQKWLDMIKNIMKAKVVFFSNNHIRDFKDVGAKKTKERVEKKGLQFVGNGTGFFEEKNIYKNTIGNKEIIIININDVVTPLFDYDLDLMKKYIQENKKENTIVVVYVHWGREYETKANERQKKLGRTFIDFGADAVVGNHSHTIQNKENYKGKMIYYSLGNLTYDSIRQEKFTQEVGYGILLGVNFHHDTVDFFEMPYEIRERKPVLLLSKEKERVLKSLEE